MLVDKNKLPKLTRRYFFRPVVVAAAVMAVSKDINDYFANLKWDWGIIFYTVE